MNVTSISSIFNAAYKERILLGRVSFILEQGLLLSRACKYELD